MLHEKSAVRIEIQGVVQGVGFRPFVFQLAKQYGFRGEVLNTPQGVTLTLEGDPEKIDPCCREIRENCPPLATVTSIDARPVEARGYEDFRIVTSSAVDASRSALIPPDVCVCRDCLDEMNDPANRRFGYPFINCTNCGPRYTIIQDVPYDRAKTSMSVFPMCPECRKEYDDPEDRRFHAQPNACERCGPGVVLVDNRGVSLDGEEPIQAAGRLLKQGAIVGVKGLGGFHLAANAFDPAAVEALRTRKKRPDKPFALMAGDIELIRPHVKISEPEEALLTSLHRPIVLLEKHEAPDTDRVPLARAVSFNNRRLGVMLPYTPLHHLLLENGPGILVMTSGNRSGEPLSIDNDDALDAFADIADYFLLHNRDIYFRADDSIVQYQDGTRFLRRSRGYAPLPVMLKKKFPPMLACGGGLKSTVCLVKENRAFLSQHIGDLDNQKTFGFYKKSVEHLENILDIEPGIVAHDLHPGYMSTGFAGDQQGVETVAVQHHHAHAVSCMAENGLEEEVIAITLDGTGLGTDNTIWGGEILTCTEEGFERQAHLTQVPMPGSDAAVKEPWRMGISWLYHAMGADFLDLDIPFVRGIDPSKIEFLIRMMDKGLNSPMTSSCGRLFDAVAAITGIRNRVSYEGQAAMELEAVSGPMPEKGYGVDMATNESGMVTMDFSPCLQRVVADLGDGEPISAVGGRFHRTVVQSFVEAASRVRERTRISKAVLSGGVFNNRTILGGISLGLEQREFTVYTHTRVPCGDGGISLGQAVIAGAMKRSRK
ncbi:MAG: carbamoyltransferase HypF [Desulfobacteraceae bacterium]|nr:carbamoyltransferase HypF [Desulfobacteraceae bacterium]